ncbi:acyclic terpene utilization AtuA family protein [Acinetobacter beijerinckii]|uniref:acyclic terpene utilization AtuA family protein n=1 Tax=Acinetobacter beijerinckii TaxID=262668 RepID=UPI0023DD6A9C|nr:acyclic terpene utilization AtuA family protein [Acinetobacter beijerinckii]MDF2417680.1 acyclic terpene utilization AtuA family protein [Acinetobacter beijerinckii]
MTSVKQDDQKLVKIGCASGFWGDTNTAAFQLVHLSDIDYLVFDYLSEITMSIMAKAMMTDPNHGYALDFVSRVMSPLINKIAEKKIKVISNAGGVNPLACRDALQKIIDEKGLDLKVAVVLGDDVLPKHAELLQKNITEMFNGESLPAHVASSNAYLGAVAIRDALDLGADIVITGRVVDSAVVLAPLLHEYKWSLDDYDKLAQGSLAGHVIECGAQCTGGNFTDWRLVQGFDNMGFPIVEVSADSSFVVTKPQGTGGLVSTATVAEQIVYEIGNPQSYLLPDVTADFSQVHLEQLGDDRVKVTGATGRAPTGQYKVSATYADGYRVLVSFLIAGREAPEKAQTIANAIINKCERVLALRSVPAFTEKSIEILGVESTYGSHARIKESREVVVKIAVKHMFKEACMFFASEIAQASTGMAPALAGIVGGRPKASSVVKLFSFLVDKDQIKVEVDFAGQRYAVDISTGSATQNFVPHPTGEVATYQGDEIEVPLIEIAHARSGDKGNHSNIGVIARKAEYLPWIRAALTEANVSDYMQHVLDSEKSKVIRYELPAMNALNFMLENALGGGGIASLRIDPQGKAFAQQLLDMPVKVPRKLIV